ncbi:MAG TPA: tetratricopeptide repeat protein, partial [Gemmataceae bacterium]|nr:tetratricopeptide repeat protein [Gemmataceae bacterium]
MPRFFIAAALLGLPTAALACLWDYDTLKQERSRFPDTLEIITGKFLRHSPEFYEWRIRDRLKKLESNPNDPRLLDDLAVAYDKTGQHDKAIETMERQEKHN